MKRTIRSLAFLLSAVVLFSACKKNKDDDAKGSFTVNGQTYITNYAINTGYKNADGQITYSDFFIVSNDYSTGNFTGKINGVGITFDNTKPTSGTYTFKDDSDPNYDPAKNFFDAYAAIDVDFNTMGGTIIGDITGGTATVTVSGDRVTITYNLDFNGQKVTGSYSGTWKSLIEEE